MARCIQGSTRLGDETGSPGFDVPSCFATYLGKPDEEPPAHADDHKGEAYQLGYYFCDLRVGHLIVNISVLGEHMDTRKIIVDLKAERDRINQAIAALESLDGTAAARSGATAVAAKNAPKQPGRRGLTPAGRRKLSAMMKARWAARRKQTAKPAAKQSKGRRTMSAAARKKIAEAQRARWAARKKAATA